jgi:hypothetical protein
MTAQEKKKQNSSKPTKPVDDTRPLAEEIEDEMLKQDIPVETGIRPQKK